MPEVLRAKAGVFVELQQRTLEVARQAELLREAEQREYERRMAEAEQRWEAEWLRRCMADEKRVASDMAAKAEELEATVGELRRAEDELTRMNEELTQADRRKDEFLAMLAHELRNPLAPLANSLELMRRSTSPARLERAREAMMRQLGHLTRLVDDLLEVSRITSGTIELRKRQVELADVVAEAVATSGPLIEERQHTLEVSAGSEPLRIEGDFVRLTQVVSNLVNNAARYTDPGGEIDIACRRDGDQARIRITDNGQGIDADAMGYIFEPFYQQRRGRGGLGMGLALVKSLVELHEGSVTVVSEGQGKGATFEMTFPLLQQPSLAEAPVRRDAEADPAPRRIVLIEDNPDILDTTRALLEEWGHEVFVAGDGRSGFELALSSRPDIALIDIGLPDVDGYEVARKLRKREGVRPARLIALSGYGQKRNREHALDAGFDSHITKPASASVLRNELAAPPGGRNAD